MASASKKRSVDLFNAACFSLATVLFAYAFLTDSPRDIAQGSRSMLGATMVAVTAAVSPNPFNTLDAQLQQKSAQLDQREAALNAREAKPDIYAIYSFIISIVLFVLLGVNFYFDRRRTDRQGGTLRAV
jgi:hypothetical protein